MVAQSPVGLTVRAGFLHYAERIQSSHRRRPLLSSITLITLTCPLNIAASTAYLSFFVVAATTDVLASLTFRALSYPVQLASIELSNRLRDRAQLHFTSVLYGCGAIGSTISIAAVLMIRLLNLHAVVTLIALSRLPLTARLFQAPGTPNVRYYALPPPLPLADNRALARAEALGRLGQWNQPLNPPPPPENLLIIISRPRLQNTITWALAQPTLEPYREGIYDLRAVINVAQLYTLQTYLAQNTPSLCDLPPPVLQALQEACFLGPAYLDPLIAAAATPALSLQIRKAKIFLQTIVNPKGTLLARDNTRGGFNETYYDISQQYV